MENRWPRSHDVSSATDPPLITQAASAPRRPMARKWLEFRGWRNLRCADRLPLIDWPDLVGLGSMCRRRTDGLDRVLPAPVRLHLFGVKSTAIAALPGRPRVASSTDSQAWDFAARKSRIGGTSDMAHRCHAATACRPGTADSSNTSAGRQGRGLSRVHRQVRRLRGGDRQRASGEPLHLCRARGERPRSQKAPGLVREDPQARLLRCGPCCQGGGSAACL